MNIFKQAAAGLNLSPEERAFLKLVKGLALVALAAAGGTAATVITNGATLHDSVLAVALTAAVAVFNAVAKLFSANGQAPLAAATQSVSDGIEQRVPELAPTAGLAEVTPAQ